MPSEPSPAAPGGGGRGFEILEHTADAGLRVWAPDLPALFAEGGLGLMAVMGEASGDDTRSQTVDIESADLEALFADWLSELIFLFETRDVVPLRFDVEVGEDPWRVHATVRGPGTSAFEQTGAAVKAVTYHELYVRPTSAGFEARVYLDV